MGTVALLPPQRPTGFVPLPLFSFCGLLPGFSGLPFSLPGGNDFSVFSLVCDLLFY